MRTSISSSTDVVGEGPALTLVPVPPWYMTPTPIVYRRELEDEHTRILARAVGEQLRGSAVGRHTNVIRD